MRVADEEYLCPQCERMVTPMSTCGDMECPLFSPRYDDEEDVISLAPMGVDYE